MAYSDTLREEIARLHIDEKKAPIDILKALADDPDFRDDLPVERTVQRIIKALADRYTPEQQALDQPWQLHPDMGNGIGPEDVPLLLDWLKWLSLWPKELLLGAASPHQALTIRRARWLATLRFVLADAQPLERWFLATIYGNRERWAVIENKPFETADADFRLAYHPWRSEQDAKTYEAAIERGFVPRLTIESMVRDEHPLDPQEAGRRLDDYHASVEGIPEGRRTMQFIENLLKEANNARNTETAEQGELEHHS